MGRTIDADQLGTDNHAVPSKVGAMPYNGAP